MYKLKVRAKHADSRASYFMDNITTLPGSQLWTLSPLPPPPPQRIDNWRFTMYAHHQMSISPSNPTGLTIHDSQCTYTLKWQLWILPNPTGLMVNNSQYNCTLKCQLRIFHPTLYSLHWEWPWKLTIFTFDHPLGTVLNLKFFNGMIFSTCHHTTIFVICHAERKSTKAIHLLLFHTYLQSTVWIWFYFIWSLLAYFKIWSQKDIYQSNSTNRGRCLYFWLLLYHVFYASLCLKKFYLYFVNFFTGITRIPFQVSCVVIDYRMTRWSRCMILRCLPTRCLVIW